MDKSINKINKLLDPEYVKKFLEKKILPLYPEFSKIKKISIIKHKTNIWPKTYHVVFQFDTIFSNFKKDEIVLPIFLTAHSDEPRREAFRALNYLWDKDFNRPELTIPRPLFYDRYFRAFLYQGLEGRNLRFFMKQNDRERIEAIVPRAAAWLAKLHATPNKNAPHLNPQNSRIRTVVPGLKDILRRIKKNHSEHYKAYCQIYKIFIKKEEAFLAQTKRRWLAHGDAHPENIIQTGSGKKPNVGVIDFTDLSLTDFARDLGTFSQQVEYMINRELEDQVYAVKIKNLFLESYAKYAKLKINDSLQARIDNYYDWTAMRTITFFFLGYRQNLEKAERLFKALKEKMGVK